jgi:type I restriction enzyme M protein
MYDLLVTGGCCGVIVPEGVLFGTSNAHIETRKILIDKCKLEGVISMPSGVFKPYAGVSTAVLVFQKGGTTDNVWFYDMDADGFSLDDKRQKTAENDIPDIIARWNQRQNSKSETRNSKWFNVPADKIRANKYDLSILRYKEIEHKEIEYEKPEAIMKKVLKLEKDIAKDIDEIKKML